MTDAAPIYAVHIRKGGNIGDRMSSPAEYFNFGREVRFFDLSDFLRSPPKEQPALVIAGGGAWKGRLAKLRRALPNVPKVAWGVGVTSDKLGPMPRNSHTKRAGGWDLYGHRDVGLEGRYVPCASCMHPAFSRRYTVEHEVVYYGHGILSPLGWAKGLGPWRTNQADSLDEVAAFLGSGDVVVTSSYHGAYWARLLGRRVALLPRGSKFWHLPPGPPLGKPYLPGILEEHRNLSRAFFQDVRALLRGGGET